MKRDFFWCASRVCFAVLVLCIILMFFLPFFFGLGFFFWFLLLVFGYNAKGKFRIMVIASLLLFIVAAGFCWVFIYPPGIIE